MMWSPDSSSLRSGWWSTTWDGAWPGVSYTCQAPRSVSTSTPGQQVAVGLHHLGDPDARALALLAVALHRLGRHARLQRHLDPALELAVGVLGRAGHVLVVGVHPQLAAGRLHDRPGQAVVVGVRVGAHEQPHVLEAQARPGRAPARAAPASRARACRCPPAPRRCPRRSRTRSRAARPATAAAGAAATRRAARGRPGPARACAGSQSQHAGVEDARRGRAPPSPRAAPRRTAPGAGGRTTGRWSRPTAWWWVMVPPAAMIASPAASLTSCHCSSSAPRRAGASTVK